MKQMKCVFLVFLCFLFLPGSAGAAESITVVSVEFYKAVRPGEFYRIYNLEPGTLKVHMDLKNIGSQSKEIFLAVQVLKNGAVLSRTQSEPKRIQNHGVRVDYLAVDVEVPDESCTLSACLMDGESPEQPLSQAYLFQKQDTVIVPDPGNQLRPLSQKASITANGTEIPLRREFIEGMIGGSDGSVTRDSPDRQFLVAKFSMSEGTPVVIGLHGRDGTRIADPLAVSPQALEIPRYVSKGVGYLIIDRPQNLVIRRWSRETGKEYEDIILLITPLETDVPYKYGPNVTYYAPGVQSCPENPAFEKNQIVYFEKGAHENVGRISLKSGMKVYLAPGATVMGKLESYDADNTKVFGRGILETRSATSKGNPKGIYYQRCINGIVEGIGVRSPFEWQTLYVDCDQFQIDNMNIMGVVLNNDGIDIDGVSDFNITNNFILAGDDNFGWHASGHYRTSTPEHPYGRPTERVRAQNNVMYNVRGGNPVRIGSCMQQESFRDVIVKDTYVVTSETGYGFYIDLQDWAVLSDMLVENFHIEELSNGLAGVIRAEVLQGMYSGRVVPSGLGSPAGRIDNVIFRNFTAPWNGGIQPVSVGGYDADHSISNLVFDQVWIQTQTPYYNGGANTAPLTREQIKKIPSTSGDGQLYVSDSDIILQ